MTHMIAIDQGTTSTRAILFSDRGEIVHVAQQEFTQYFPDDGWVEHDAEEIWRSTVSVVNEIIDRARRDGLETAAVGITNQRETTVVWDRDTGKPVSRAIVWQDRRTASACAALKEKVSEVEINASTGLLLDPYFSATKIAWILDNVEGARQRAQKGELAFGTTDSYLIYRLTGGRHHLTDATNASRTLLFNIRDQRWDEKLLELFDVPAAMLPEVRDSAADFGRTTSDEIIADLPIAGVAGDQQAAVVGQACFHAGMAKSTYGTGCFMLFNIGEEMRVSGNRLLTTVAYRLEGTTTYALEGSIFNAGTTIQWLRDSLGIIDDAGASEAAARRLESNRGVYLVPAFTGLGAPHWDPDVRGALYGLTRATGRDELVRAALESVCYQTHDLVTAMADDVGHRIDTIRVDGGMVANNWLLEFLANVLDARVDRPEVIETTALGAAFLAGLHSGVFDSLDDIENAWRCDRQFEPAMDPALRRRCLDGWAAAVARTLHRGAS